MHRLKRENTEVNDNLAHEVRSDELQATSYEYEYE